MFKRFKSPKQLNRKERTEKFLKSKGVKINEHLPHIEAEEDTTLRTPKEIAQRVSVLATTNMVAFNVIEAEDAIEYLKTYHLWELLTPKEKSFLESPTDDKKTQETWKCEGIWVLMWALGVIEDIGYPDKMCDLNQIPFEKYPIGEGKDPNTFINSFSKSRTKTEILDANDLYYRMDWTCVDARLNGYELNGLNPGVVYERHYALNWLVNYMDQEWDDISCDT
ncbi:protein of unknown function [Zobellia uliginosa]|uniref:DUF4272 domain-containing protein n=1 Tax=Zobellia uliginosa TaxID=143224 RepID=A0ABY1KL81_9FLAO|nr:DUF4272 domain-containing protein [Zobellia uliginosa]SIS47173.1 protein of unknown function [Zobellia uliginosa]